MRNGVDLEFNTKGDLIEVDALTTLSSDFSSQDVIHERAYGRLEKDGWPVVETIELNRGRFTNVDLNIAGPDTYVLM